MRSMRRPRGGKGNVRRKKGEPAGSVSGLAWGPATRPVPLPGRWRCKRDLPGMGGSSARLSRWARGSQQERVTVVTASSGPAFHGGRPAADHVFKSLVLNGLTRKSVAGPRLPLGGTREPGLESTHPAGPPTRFSDLTCLFPWIYPGGNHGGGVGRAVPSHLRSWRFGGIAVGAPGPFGRSGGGRRGGFRRGRALGFLLLPELRHLGSQTAEAAPAAARPSGSGPAPVRLEPAPGPDALHLGALPVEDVDHRDHQQDEDQYDAHGAPVGGRALCTPRLQIDRPERLIPAGAAPGPTVLTSLTQRTRWFQSPAWGNWHHACFKEERDRRQPPCTVRQASIRLSQQSDFGTVSRTHLAIGFNRYPPTTPAGRLATVVSFSPRTVAQRR